MRNDKTILNGTNVSRRWVLGGVAASTTQLYTAAAAGALAYEVTRRGMGGNAEAPSVAGDNANAAVRLQRLSLSAPLHYNQAGSSSIVGAANGSTLEIVVNSLQSASSYKGLSLDTDMRTLSGTSELRAVLVRETLSQNVRNTLIGIPDGKLPTMRLGMNMAGIGYFTPNDLFLDYLKYGGYQPTANPPTLNENGYPTAIGADGNNNAGTPFFLPLDDGTVTPVKYRIKTDGDYEWALLSVPESGSPKETVGFAQTDFVKEGGDWVITYTGSGAPFAHSTLVWKVVHRPATYVHFLREDDLPRYNAGKMLKQSAVDDLSRFAWIRAMNMSGCVDANLNQHVTRPISYISYAGITPMIALAAIAIELNVPIWINLNYRISDTEFQALWPILTDLKNRRLLAAIEYGNEVWNLSTFAQQGNWCTQQAMAHPAYVEKNRYTAAQWWMGYRSAQLAKLARSAGHVLPWVIGAQPVQPGLWPVVKAGILAVLDGRVGDFPYYMSTGYGSGIVNLGVTGAMGAALDSWVASGDHDALLDNVLNYLSSAPEWGNYTTSIVNNAAILAQTKAMADNEGMQLVCYEGQLHLNAQPFARNIPAYSREFVEIYKSTVAKIAARALLEYAQAAGVSIFMWFDWNSKPTQVENGYFGTKGLPAYDALDEWLQQQGGSTTTPSSPSF